MREVESTSNSQNANSTINPVDHLPLSLLRSEYIPSAPTRSESTIDWLPEFSGYSWVAYGASSLLVISHLPSPFFEEETVIGPLFRQVFELSDDSSPVTAVSWSPVTPSAGELAAASQNCISVFSHDSESSKGSFCWRQNAVLVQSTEVEAIDWTGSGDGIIAVGVEVILWKKKNKLWEIAWKYKVSLPQNLVSGTWSIDGPSASATYMSEQNGVGSNETGKCVFVCYGDGKAEYAKLELRHPQPISMVKWRPSTRSPSLGDSQLRQKHVLLTCCLDGTVRLWSEMDNGRVRKVGKDNNDHKTTRLGFSVAAVIEINQSLNGVLGVDVRLTWATEIRGVFGIGKEADKLISTRGDDNEKAGKCEWLIGFGPRMLVTYWAIHCLDGLSPLRFPRVTLWKKHSLEPGNLRTFAFSSFKESSLLNKVVISRNNLYGPPIICSLIHLSPCNILVWSSLRTQLSDNMKDSSFTEGQRGNFLSYSDTGVLNTDGHVGKILQVAIHPYISEVELAVSLDSNGLLLFWSLSTISSCFPGLPMLNPTWKICGRFGTQGSCSKYTILSWAPTVLDDDRVLLMGHVGGIDCFIVKFSQSEADDIVCHYICTLPFTGYGPYDFGPNNIFSIPLPSSYKKTIKYNKFMLLAVWMEGFEALSWEITLHAFDLPEPYCEPNGDNDNNNGCMWRFENTFSGKRYCLSVNPCSSQFPEPHNHNQVTSFAVVCPSSLIPIENQLGNDNDLCRKVPNYTMATGYTDGSLKLWRSNPGQASTPSMAWELVGMFAAQQGPITAIGLTDCGRKIATVCRASDSNAVSTICIWESVYLTGLGSFVLEDTLSFDRNVVAVKWLTLENGQFLLGSCMQNELRIYAQKHCDLRSLSNPSNSLDMRLWVCIGFGHTSPAIHDFFWGRKATAIVVHDSYFSLLSQRLFLVDEKHRDKWHSNIIMGNPFYESGMCGKGDHRSSSFLVGNDQLRRGSAVMLGSWSILEIAEKFWGSLPVYHPVALLMNICLGNWKRAYVSVRHLVEYLSSSNVSVKTYQCAKSCNSVPQILLSNYYEGLLSKGTTGNEIQWSGDDTSMSSSSQLNRGFGQFAYNLERDAASHMFDSSSPNSELSGFIDSLDKSYGLAAILNREKMEILAVIDLLKEVSNTNTASAYENFDEPGRRFWVGLRSQQLYLFRRFRKLVSIEELVVDSGLMAWAFHSDCQEALVGSFLPNEPSWPEMRTLGVGFWFTNATQLRSRMEKLARLQYLKKKDPKDCALLYVALGRLQVLAGLFKISRDEKDKRLVAFLSRNFQEEKNKAAALKNAYVLLGRHQLELAVAFFLLGGDAASAVNICAKNLGDEQLALVICRLLEGYGGPLEHHLISKMILPSAIDREDYWLVSLLEWQLGNYSQSFQAMFGSNATSASNKFVYPSNSAAFMDPSIGSYCLTLANNNSLKNAVGERSAAVLVRWATLVRATAFNRCGLPLEALECLSSAPNTPGNADQGSISNGSIQRGILKPPVSNSWLAGDIAFHLESQTKLDLALQYLSKLMSEHPSWLDLEYNSNSTSYTASEIHQYEKLLENFRNKLNRGLAHYEQRFLLDSSCLIRKVLVFLCNNGLLFMGSDILRGYASQCTKTESSIVDKFLLDSLQHKSLLKSTEDIATSLSQFISAAGRASSHFRPSSNVINVSSDVRSMCKDAWGFYFQHVISSLCSLRAAVRLISGSLAEDLVSKPLALLDLYEYFIHFAFAWLQKDSKSLLLMIQPLLLSCTNGCTPYEVNIMNLKKVLQVVKSGVLNKAINSVEEGLQVPKLVEDKQSGGTMHSIPEDERWKIVAACVWQHMFRFLKYKLHSISIRLDDNHFPGASHLVHSSLASSLTNPDSASISTPEHTKLFSFILAKLLRSTLFQISSYQIKQLVSLLQQKVEYGHEILTHRWLKESCAQPRALHQHLNQDDLSSGVVNNKDEAAISELLWNVCADPNLISQCFAEEKVNLESYITCKSSKGWSNLNESVTMQQETEETVSNEGRSSTTQVSGAVGSPDKGLVKSSHGFLSSWQKDPNVASEITPFQTPKEVCKRNGELLEALCINSIDQRQAALASNRKGIVFIDWEDRTTFRHQSEYIWSDADWPLNGWAGLESTPVPTPVSPGIGLGVSKGAHLGLGGATTGVGSSVRPGRDFTGGGAFGIPGYAGIGASGLGREIQDEFEEFVDPPATVENISTRAFSSHPSRPFFLVGSSNTHVYLWEFGKHKATATYGVLPAANVPPPYALASISALHFDYCGHRFASAALDGTVCTWQLEVGGRSNVRPTESSLCFNGHASDVTYITSSGSIVAAAGYSSSGINVVIWDTLAPPTTSRASITCHEGGARSISVFDNNIGSGSVSPFIVTGGKGGDVGVHDFRYIATGKSKKHRHMDSSETSISSSPKVDTRTGVENKSGDQSGMLWYIPKAHLGSVTKISTIPNTSLFLTGSKDGDVKLWDAKAAKLVYHWPKLHERHTFLQPSSRGFGGVVRAAVTDIQVISNGFLTCGGDGSVKMIQLKDHRHRKGGG